MNNNDRAGNSYPLYITLVLLINLLITMTSSRFVSFYFGSSGSVFYDCLKLLLPAAAKCLGLSAALALIRSAVGFDFRVTELLKPVRFSPLLLPVLPSVILAAGIGAKLLFLVFDRLGIHLYSADIIYANKSITVYAVYFLTVVIIPAVVEEVLFRGAVMQILSPPLGDKNALITQAVLFGMIHCHPEKIPYAIAGGLFLGYVRMKSNSLFPAIILHAVSNGMFYILTVFDSYDTFTTLFALAIFTFGVLCLFFLIKSGYFRKIKGIYPNESESLATFWSYPPMFVYTAVILILIIGYFYI